MLDFSSIRNDFTKIDTLLAGLTRDDLRDLTNEMIDTQQGYIADSTDADVTFEPTDPEANDTFADNPDEVDIAWTLGHVIVHATASSEESAFLAAELARGVEPHGRSRYETPWPEVTTIEQCRQRLEESRRMRLATLDVWPNEPHLDNKQQPFPGAPKLDAYGRFVAGLAHDDSHLGQIQEIVRQAKAARGA